MADLKTSSTLSGSHKSVANDLMAILEGGGVVNLIGPVGTARASVLREVERQTQMKGIQVAVFDQTRSATQLIEGIKSAADAVERGTSRFICIEGWERLVPREADVETFQRNLHRYLSGRGKHGIVFASESSVARLQKESGNEVIPANVLGHITVLNLATATATAAGIASSAGVLGAIGTSVGLLPVFGFGLVSAGAIAAALLLASNNKKSRTPTAGAPRETLALRAPAVRERFATTVANMMTSGDWSEAPTVDALMRLPPQQSSERALLWMNRFLGEAQMRPANESSGPPSVRALVDDGVAMLAWEQFVRGLVERHGWLGDEMRAEGFDISAPDAHLGSYLVRTGRAPDEFLAALLRPSDLRTLFPNALLPASRREVLREAFDAWQGNGGAA